MLISESKFVNIVEARGVAISPWKKEIDAIATYIRKEVKSLLESNPTQTQFTFSIPSNLLKGFTFMKNLKMNVDARYDDKDTYTGGGSFRNGKVSFFRKRIKGAVINLICFYNKKGNVWLHTILDTLYHEFNHAYDAWINGHSDKKFRRFYKSGDKGLLGNAVEEGTPLKNIGVCIYRLFSETEYNALVASVFGGLQGMDSDFTTFREDYKYTHAYYVYNDLKNGLQAEVDSLNDIECTGLLSLLIKYGISINMRNNNAESFKRAFMHKAEIKLNNLLHDIGRVASYYYDKKQEEHYENLKNLEIK